MNAEIDIDKKASKAGIWYTIGNIALKGVLFLSLPIFTRVMLPEDFGYYNNYIAYEQIFTAILGLGIYGTIKNAKIDFKDDFDIYFSSIIALCLILLFLVEIFTNVIMCFASSILGFNRIEINILIVQSFCAALLYLYGVKLNAEFKYKRFLVFSALNVIGNIVISLLLIYYVFPSKTYVGRIVGSAAPLLLISTLIMIESLKEGIHIRRRYIRYALSLGIPLIPHVLSQSLLNQFDRIMINSIVGSLEAGVYGCVYTLSTVLQVIAGSIENAWSPWLFINLSEKKGKEIDKISKMIINFFFMLSIGFMCVMPEFSIIFLDSKYWSGIPLIFPLSVAMFFSFMYTFPANIEYYNKKTSNISLGTIGSATMNIILNYFCITNFGYRAAAYTTIISYISLFVFHWLIAEQFEINTIYDKLYFVKKCLIIFFVGIILDIAYKYYYVNLFIRIVLLLYVCYHLFSYRKLFVMILKSKVH